MAAHESKLIARRFIEEILGQGRLDLLEELTAADYADHNLPSGVTPRQSIAAFRAGFPDAQVMVEDIIGEDDKAVVRYTISGTHTGSLYGIPPTGKAVRMTGISMYRTGEGKLVEGWVEYDQLGLLQQLGVVPPAG